MRIKKNLARYLYHALISIKGNNKGTKPPADRGYCFDKLVLCFEFEPFHKHGKPRKKKTAKRHMNNINFYYELFDQEGQQEMRHHIDRDDSLHYRLP